MGQVSKAKERRDKEDSKRDEEDRQLQGLFVELAEKERIEQEQITLKEEQKRITAEEKFKREEPIKKEELEIKRITAEKARVAKPFKFGLKERKVLKKEAKRTTPIPFLERITPGVQPGEQRRRDILGDVRQRFLQQFGIGREEVAPDGSRQKAIKWLEDNAAQVTEANIKAVTDRFGF